MLDFLEHLLHTYPQVVEFLVYLLFFGALSRAALTSQFGDEPARRLALPIGLVLAAALTLAADRPWSMLERIGPLAFILVLTAVWALAYGFLRFMDTPPHVALGLTVLLAIISLRTLEIEPLNDYLDLSADWILYGVGLVAIVLWALATHEHRPGPGRPFDKRRLTIATGPSRPDLSKIVRGLKNAVSHNAKDNMRQERKSGRALKRAAKLVDDRENPRAADKTRRCLQEAEIGASRISANLARLQRLDRALLEADWNWLKRTSTIRALNAPEAQALRSNIHAERARLEVERQIETLTESAERHVDNVRRRLQAANNEMETNNNGAATALIRDANTLHRQGVELDKQILGMENLLLRLFRKQLRDM